MNKIRRLIKKIIPNKILERRKESFLVKKVLLSPDSFIVSSGLWRSLQNREPVDNSDNPMPWICYPMINFLQERLNKKMLLFEYGSGYSTLFFANYVNKIYSVEYDKLWFDKINTLNKKPANAHIIYSSLENDYVESVRNTGLKEFDVIFIDGRKRVDCCKYAFAFLKPDDVMILDDSDRKKYKEAFSFFSKQGYAFISLSGMKPTDCRKTQSTIFYKRGNNCFNI